MANVSPKILMTRRTWQLCGCTAFVWLTTVAQYYPLSVEEGAWLGGGIFLIVFPLTSLREERRALYSPDSDFVINWNLAEAIALFLSILGYLIIAFVHDFDRSIFYAYFHTALLGWLSGLSVGECLWHNVQLGRLDETSQQRYWANYKDSII